MKSNTRVRTGRKVFSVGYGAGSLFGCTLARSYDTATLFGFGHHDLFHRLAVSCVCVVLKVCKLITSCSNVFEFL